MKALVQTTLRREGIANRTINRLETGNRTQGTAETMVCGLAGMTLDKHSQTVEHMDVY
jgi:hypothetical protein